MYEDLKVKKKKYEKKTCSQPLDSHGCSQLETWQVRGKPGVPVSIIMSGNSVSEVAEDAELSVVALEAERYKNCGGKKKTTRGLQLIPYI